MIATTKIYYDGDLIVEMPPTSKLSLDIKGRTPRANILIEKVMKYSVSVSAEEHGSAIGGGAFDLGDSVTVIATPDSGYMFDGWYSNGTKVSEELSYTFTIAGDTNLVAKFKQTQVILNVTTAGLAFGDAYFTINGGTRIYESEDPISVHAGDLIEFTASSNIFGQGSITIFGTKYTPSEGTYTIKASWSVLGDEKEVDITLNNNMGTQGEATRHGVITVAKHT